MLYRYLTLGGAFIVLAVTAPLANAQERAKPAMRDVVNAGLTWSDIDVPGFLPGVKIAVIHGDPSAADKPYTLRLRFPDGYRFPPHWHPRAENVTVLEGTFQLAMGRRFEDGKMKAYRVGDFLFIPPEQPHFGQVRGRTVVQLHGTGPFEIMVVDGQEMTAR